MSLFSEIDARQIISRDLLGQLFPNVSGQQLDLLLRSIDGDLSFLLRLDAGSPASHTINVGPGITGNSVTGRNKSIPFIQNVIPNFTSGSIVFPGASGGTVAVSPGINQTLVLPAGQYCKVLISLDSSGNLNLSIGAPNAVEANASVPAPTLNTIPVGYISLHNTAGSIDVIAQNKIFQFGSVAPIQASGGGGGSGSGYIANSQPIPNGADTVAISFVTPQNDTSYVVLPMLENTVDPNPANFQILSIVKTVNGFTCKLNAPTDSNNYKLAYVIPLKAFPMGEVPITAGMTSVAATFGIPDNGPNYGLLAFLQNITDASPQFQPLVVTAKSASGFTGQWNVGTDSSNYKLIYLKTASAQQALAQGVTSASFTNQVDYGNANYAIIAVMHNLVDLTPEYQPLLVSAKSGSAYTISWQDPTDSVNYTLVSYAISFA